MKRGEQVPDCLVKTLLFGGRRKEGLDHLDMAILCSAFMIGGVGNGNVNFSQRS